MIEPKDKAKELIDKFKPHAYNGAEEEDDERMQLYHAKRGALIAATEVLEATPMYTGNLNPKWKYWDEVKQEIEKL